MTAIRSFLRLVREAPRAQVAGLVLLMALAGLTEGVGVLLLVPLLETLQGGSNVRSPLIAGLLGRIQAAGLPPSLGGLLAAFLVLTALRGGVQYAREIIGAKLQHRLVDTLRERCFAALSSAEWRWVVATRKSDHANLLLTDVGRVGVGLNAGLALAAVLATIPAYLLAAFALSPAMTCLASASGGLVLSMLSGERRKALRLGENLGAANRAMQGRVQENLDGLKLAKILGNERRHLDLFSQTTSRLRRQQLQFAASVNLSRVLFQTGSAVLLAGYLYLGFRVWHAAVPELLTLVMIFSRLIPLSVSAQQQYHQWLHALPALQETDRLLAECRAAAEPEEPAESAPWPAAAEIRLQRVTLRYAGRERPALDDVSLIFPARTTTAIIGASGAGKSTLADVLTGLLAPDQGALLIDGAPAAGPRRKRWRRSTAYVPQEVFLLNDSIRNNLLWGLAGADEDDLILALERAAADFAFRLPDRLDTVVGDGGIRLSGGERQRLVLARALLSRPSLLILDEATSALDLENEARVRQAVENLHGDLTVIVIGHRLPTLEHADQVVVLDEGRVAAQGTWGEIRASEPLHASAS